MKTPPTTDYLRTSDLTIAEIKSCVMFSHLTDDEAKEVIDTLKQFTRIVYNFYHKNKEKALENP